VLSAARDSASRCAGSHDRREGNVSADGRGSRLFTITLPDAQGSGGQM